MGLFDRFKKKQKEELYKDDNEYDIYDIDREDSSKHPLEEFNEQKLKELEEEKQKEEFEFAKESIVLDKEINNIEENANNLVISPSIETIKNISLEETKRFSGALSREEFNNKYKKISDFKTALSLKEQMGLDTNFSKEAMDTYDKVKNSLVDPDKFRKELFFPYYIEKEQYNCLDQKERDELNILKESISDESSLQRFILGLAYYQVLGINDINDASTFNKSLIDYYHLDEENLMLVRERVLNVTELVISGVEDKQNDELKTSGLTK